MTHPDLIPDGVAEPHQSTVAAILRATRQGLFTAAEAGLLIDRVRAHVSTFPLGVSTSGVLPDRTV